jgi:hypothetical protein
MREYKLPSNTAAITRCLVETVAFPRMLSACEQRRNRAWLKRRFFSPAAHEMENVERRRRLRRLFGRLCEKGLDGRKKYRDHFGPLRRCSLKSLFGQIVRLPSAHARLHRNSSRLGPRQQL